MQHKFLEGRSLSLEYGRALQLQAQAFSIAHRISDAEA
jgi:hypothetical protein